MVEVPMSMRRRWMFAGIAFPVISVAAWAFQDFVLDSGVIWRSIAIGGLAALWHVIINGVFGGLFVVCDSTTDQFPLVRVVDGKPSNNYPAMALRVLQGLLFVVPVVGVFVLLSVSQPNWSALFVACGIGAFTRVESQIDAWKKRQQQGGTIQERLDRLAEERQRILAEATLIAQQKRKALENGGGSAGTSESGFGGGMAGMPANE